MDVSSYNSQENSIKRRILRELSKRDEYNGLGVSWMINDEACVNLTGTISGQKGTLYEGGIFELEISIPPKYPWKEPTVKFITRMWHPNISDTGQISGLREDWTPFLTISDMLLSIQNLLSLPNFDNPLHDVVEYAEKAESFTRLYASQIQYKEKVNSRLAKLGVYQSNTQKNTPEDWNSFFHAVTDQITGYTHEELQNKVVSSVRDTYTDKDYKWPSLNIEEWKSKMLLQGTIPDKLCLQTASNVIERDLNIYYSTTLSANDIKNVKSKVSNNLPPVWLLYYEDGFYKTGHYQSIITEIPVDDIQRVLTSQQASNSVESEKEKKEDAITELDGIETVCKCKLKLGIHPLSSKDNNEIINRNKIDREEIFFQGPTNTQKRTTVENVISEINKKISKYYFSENSQLIALPNEIKLPDDVCINGAGRREKYEIFLDKHCEEYLHHQLVKALRNEEAYIEMGFQSDNILKVLVNKAKDLRNNKQFDHLNKYELKVLGILEEDLKEEDLDQCIDLHKQWKADINQEISSKSHLFKEECLLPSH